MCVRQCVCVCVCVRACGRVCLGADEAALDGAARRGGALVVLLPQLRRRRLPKAQRDAGLGTRPSHDARATPVSADTAPVAASQTSRRQPERHRACRRIVLSASFHHLAPIARLSPPARQVGSTQVGSTRPRCSTQGSILTSWSDTSEFTSV